LIDTNTVSLAPGLAADSSGALWLPDSSTLLVADLHLGYGFAQRRRGELGPVLDDQASAKLDAVLSRFTPSRIVFLGDLVHAPGPSPLEKEWILDRLRAWAARSELLLVRGNHDRAFELDFAGAVEMCEHGVWRAPGIVAVHGDRAWPEPAPEELLILGHIHPAFGVGDSAGVRQRVPVFLHAPGRMIVLPAFSPFAAGLDVLRRFPADLQPYMEILEAVAATGKRAVPLGSLTRLMEDAANTGRGATAQDFQRLRYHKH